MMNDERFTDWYGFDTENDANGKVTLAALIREDGRKWVWKKAGKFVEWCENLPKEQRPMVVCHNLEYDLINEFGEHYPYMQLNYLKGRLISARFKNVNFYDSFNHFRMSLKELGKSLGIRKLDFDIHSKDYVTTDAWICLQGMVKARDYIASIGGKLGATSGSSAVSVWEAMTGKEFEIGPVDTPWLRLGYYGGRTEIFRVRTEGKIRGYDINSMYPFCMKCEFPETLPMDKGMDRSKGMAEVLIKIPKDLYVAPLPYRSEDKLLYPVGFIRGVWTYDEIRYAESLGSKVLTIFEAYGSNSLMRPFDEYIDTLYDKRMKSKDESERLFLKVLMNSLYGKIASKNTITRVVSKTTMQKTGSRRMGEVKWIDRNRGLLDFQTPARDYVNVCWGAMITANSRIMLTKHLANIPDTNLIYCDTDSVYCEGIKIPTSDGLGGMKLEREARIMVVVQPKAYRLDDYYKAKGVPKPKLNEKGEIEINYAKQYIEEGYTEFQAPIRFRASLNSKRGEVNQWVKHHKTMRSGYMVKNLRDGRYYPPVINHQGELPLQFK